jgi:D-tagatose-bisphosphate aldolase class II non-catalytic subunit
MSAAILTELASQRKAGQPFGITSVCSAHPLVVEAALRQALEEGTPALIEATCNQVNHQGGYTGMTPSAFRDFVAAIALKIGFPMTRVILGGDHLGPNPWKTLPAHAAMAEAEAMVEAYVDAGFAKLHLDTSMGCAEEPVALEDRETAERAARLALVAERVAARRGDFPYYVIGTEVPTPGGALETLEHLQVTNPEAPVATYQVHRNIFLERGLGDMLPRIIALVVQPGVEFDHDSVVQYDASATSALSGALVRLPDLVFEAHSTDYQTEANLRGLVRDGFPILKVGPALTFALREALYGLDSVASVLAPSGARESLMSVVERVMIQSPKNWWAHYRGDESQLRVLRHFSYSDRIRYYWPETEVGSAIEAMFGQLDGVRIPATLVSQYLPRLYDRVAAGLIAPEARTLAIETVRDVLRGYARACRPVVN